MPHAANLIRVARGELPADLVLHNAQVVNTVTASIDHADVAIYEGLIAGVGTYNEGSEHIDLDGDYLLPGLVDGHTHIESSMLHPARYAEAVVPRGTLTLVTDLHEIANACGLDGIEFAIRWSHRIPLDMLFMAPSCVPATPLETSGAELGPAAIRQLLARPEVIGLGEVMNYPGVLSTSPDVMDKIEAAKERPIDGHAPGLRGADLNAYLAAGIMSDHECTTREEAEEKLRKGMWLMLREGSSEKNVEELLPAVTDSTFHHCMFVVDDRTAADLAREGDIDHVVRRAIALGMNPIRAIQLATYTPARYFRMYDRGSIAAGKIAHLITVRDLHSFVVDRVFHRGRLVTQNGQPLFSVTPDCHELTDTVRLAPTAHALGLISPTLYEAITKEQDQIAHLLRTLTDKNMHIQYAQATTRGDTHTAQAAITSFVIQSGITLSARGYDNLFAELLYEPYKERELREIEKSRTYRSLLIPRSFSYTNIPGLSRELQEKLIRHAPTTIAEAQKIPGITPATIALLIFKLRESDRKQTQSKI